MSSIFIIAKDSNLLKSLKYLFVRLGYNVSTFCNPSSMLSELNEQGPDCILAEAQNSNSATIKFLKNVRRRLPATPVIIVVSNGDISQAIEALRAGASDCIQTPIVDRILVETVQKTISNPDL